jgi:hypothetical protein
MPPAAFHAKRHPAQAVCGIERAVCGHWPARMRSRLALDRRFCGATAGFEPAIQSRGDSSSTTAQSGSRANRVRNVGGLARFIAHDSTRLPCDADRDESRISRHSSR